MSRAIKFRAWDGEKIIPQENLYWMEDRFVAGVWNYEETHIAQNQQEVDLMQFTGLHDKNGKEIYEDDVVKHTMPHQPYAKRVTILGLIEYVEVSCSFRTVSDYYGEEPIHEDIEIEVIGNIHETPELLETQND